MLSEVQTMYWPFQKKERKKERTENYTLALKEFEKQLFGWNCVFFWWFLLQLVFFYCSMFLTRCNPVDLFPLECVWVNGTSLAHS